MTHLFGRFFYCGLYSWYWLGKQGREENDKRTILHKPGNDPSFIDGVGIANCFVVFGSNRVMEFYQILILIIAGAIAIRFTFKFDLNKHLESKRKIKTNRLKNICPHCSIRFIDEDNLAVRSFFHSPRGTFDWVCTRCGRIVHSEEDAKRMVDHYAKDPKAFLEAEKKFVKEMKKLKLA